MPRKQNGFGNSRSLGFKGAGRVDRGKGVGAPGTYPSNRRYGSSVHRTVIEKYNLDSNWVKWRKGFEYYNQAAWYRLSEENPDYDPTQPVSDDNPKLIPTQIKSKLYQGTDYEVDVVFDGYKFATKNSDSNNHYVMKRTTVSSPDLGVVAQVDNDPLKFSERKKYREVWVKGTAGTAARLLTRMIGERITDGETEATLNYLLNDEGLPLLYVGKSYEELTTVKVTVPIADLIEEPGGETLDTYQQLVGKVCYIPNFYQEKAIDLVDTAKFTDDDYYWTVDVKDFVPGQQMSILDPEQEELPPSLYDINTLPVLYKTDNCSFEVAGKYIYKKDLYQRYYGNKYLSASLVEDKVDQCSYTVMPFRILEVEERNGQLELKSVPFDSEFRLTIPAGTGAILVFADWSFTKLSLDEYDGRDYHKPGAPGSSPWMRIDTDVDPWMDEVFTTGYSLRPATVYTCSCPNHSHAILRAPDSTADSGTRKRNRQERYPMPTVLGKNDFDSLASNKASGIVESWESREHRMSFKMCKHSIAAMFIEQLKIKEPSEYPTLDAREKFEEKLREEIAEVADEFNLSYKRGGITALEVIFAMAQGLNLDDVELAYVMLNANY